MEIDVKSKCWREFLIGDLFSVGTGSLVAKNILIKGDLPRITATNNNNGIFDFYNNIDIVNYKTNDNFISVSFLGSVFYHSYKASLDMKIHSLKLKKYKLNKYNALFLALSIFRTACQFSYGDQLSSTDLPKKYILLPIDLSGDPDFEFMELYVKQIEKLKLSKYFNSMIKRIDNIKDFGKVESLSEKKWSEFYLYEIFSDIQRGKRLKKNDHILGNIPYVSSTGLNNGVDGFIGNTKNVRLFNNCLSLANSGSVGAAFYQPFTFIASDHITKLKNDSFNEYIYLFISTIVKRFGDKYSFNREINDRRIQREKIILPVNRFGEPDYEYMENYIKKIEYDMLVKYKEFKY